MTPRDRSRLGDALRFARKAVTLVGEDGADTLEQDETRLLALVGALILLGEAVSQLSGELRERLPNVPWREAKNLRNLLVHRYFEIKTERLVQTTRDDLPGLIDALEQVLAEGDETP